MKLYDFDGMFDEKLSDYIKKNSGKYKEEEWEDIIPALYNKFGDTVIKSIGKTPRGFYADMTDAELVKSLKTHLKQGVPVSEFLCEAIEKRNASELLLPLLDGSTEEKTYAVNLLGAADEAVPKYMEILVATDDENLKEACAERAKEKADLVKDAAVKNYEDGIEREYMLEIMCRSVVRDERIFKILLNEFRASDEDLPLRAAYLASYGDERALDYLLARIEDEDINFVDFTELKFAIEALGGEYTKERDFSQDPYYVLVKSHGGASADIFGGTDKK